MADAEDIQPLVCDNGTGMVKVSIFILLVCICISMNFGLIVEALF